MHMASANAAASAERASSMHTWAATFDKSRIEIVVARHHEPALPWVTALAEQGWPVVVYDKADACGRELPDPAAAGLTVVRCPNVGREGETWLRHVQERYDALPDATLFLQGCPYDHARLKRGDITALLWRVQDAVRTWIKRGEPEGAHPFATGPHTEGLNDCYGLPVADYYLDMFTDGRALPQDWTFAAGAQYLVPRATLRAQPQAFYETWAAKARACSAHSYRQCSQRAPDSIDAWTLERLWPHIWRAPRAVLPLYA